MPCDSISTVEVKFDKANPDLIRSAMAVLYPNTSYTVTKAGKLTVSGFYGNTDELAVAVKKEMTKQTVVAQAKRFGWAVQTQADGKLLLQKARL